MSYWSAGMSEQIEDLARVENDPTHYETDCFCEGACDCSAPLTEEEMEAAEAAAEAQYDAWVNR